MSDNKEIVIRKNKLVVDINKTVDALIALSSTGKVVIADDFKRAVGPKQIQTYSEEELTKILFALQTKTLEHYGGYGEPN